MGMRIIESRHKKRLDWFTLITILNSVSKIIRGISTLISTLIPNLSKI